METFQTLLSSNGECVRCGSICQHYVSVDLALKFFGVFVMCKYVLLNHQQTSTRHAR